jgi:hypothetical protein
MLCGAIRYHQHWIDSLLLIIKLASIANVFLNHEFMKKEKIFETILTLVIAAVIFGLMLKIKVLLTIAVILGLIGLFIKPLAELISKIWLKFSELLGTISSKILLSLVYFIFLVPIAFLYKLFNKDSMKIKNKYGSTFIQRNHKYVKEDLEQPW